MNYKSYSDKVKRYFAFTKKEWIHFILITLVFAFIFSFKEWGVETFDASMGIKNFATAIIIAGVSVFIHHSVQRLVALHYGYRPEHRTLKFGIIFGLLAALLTNGGFPVFIGSALSIHFLPIHRLGKHRFGINLKSHAIIAFTGPLANLLLAGSIKLINFSAQSVFLNKLIIFNLLFAVYNMLPIPPLDGGCILWASRLLYSFTAGLTIGFIVLYLILSVPLILAILGSLLFALVCFIAFFMFFEIKWG